MGILPKRTMTMLGLSTNGSGGHAKAYEGRMNATTQAPFGQTGGISYEAIKHGLYSSIWQRCYHRCARGVVRQYTSVGLTLIASTDSTIIAFRCAGIPGNL